MNDTLKAAGRIGAELGAAKAENEKLRGLLRECAGQIKADIHAALSRQAEPTDTFTAVDMATAAAQGFRDGQAAVEQAAAQDEREAFKRALHSQKVFKLSSATIDAAEWAWFSRPAQTEQQPVAHVVGAGYSGIDTANPKTEWMEIGVISMPLQGRIPLGAKLYLEPIAQTSPHDAPYAPGIAEQLERTDWTPEEALRWYAEGKHFDTVNGRTRIIDSGAIASNALKHLSLSYLEMKGDAELSELRAQAEPAPAQAEQQPIGRVFTDEERFRSDGKSGPVWWFGPPPAGAMLYAAPIAQTAPVALEHVSEGADLLQSMIDNIESNGNYSRESTVLFLNQALGCIRAALSAQGAGDADS